MARYPTFEEYQQRGNFRDGIKRCDDFLKKNPNDVQLLTVKLQLVYATGGDEAAPILQKLLSIQPPIQDVAELVSIDQVVVDSQHDVFPRPTTTGPEVSKLWENAVKASGAMNQKLNLLLERFARAVINSHVGDAQQTLIQVKALQPKNRVIYMAHAAYTQLLSTSREDLQSRLAVSLARKAVTEKFDDDASLDCRVPGQIFALQDAYKDLEGILDRPFKESKQFHDAMRKTKAMGVNGVATETTIKDHTSTSSSASCLSSEVASLKKLLSDLINASAELEAFLSVAANAIKLFHSAATSKTDSQRRAMSDACFLAVSALVRVYGLKEDSRHLLQGAYLVETLLRYNPHVHEARMILVYLYMRLGLASLATRLFVSLNVKEVQFDTVGHALFTRLSLLHPHSMKLVDGAPFDPVPKLRQALTVYTRSEDRLAENEASVLNHGQTGMIFDLHQLRDRLRSSTSRRIMLLELRRCHRLMGASSKSQEIPDAGPKCVANWLESIDNRDFDATFNHGFNVEKALHGDHGTVPGRRWILLSLAVDTAWCLATQAFEPPVHDAENVIQELESDAVEVGRLNVDDSDPSSVGMRQGEYLAGDLACQVLKLSLHLSQDASGESATLVDAVHKAVARLNVDALVKSEDTFSQSLNDHYLYMDVLRVVMAVCDLAEKQAKKRGVEFEAFGKSIREQIGAIQKHAEEQKKRVKGEEIMKLMMDEEGDVSNAIESFGRVSVTGFCEAIATSARDGWEGVLKVKDVSKI